MGECTIQGAKNSALPILAATLVSDGVSRIRNCPDLLDIDAVICDGASVDFVEAVDKICNGSLTCTC